MIEIKEKKDCCGCGACVQKCPRQCITMEEDYEGFIYPIVYKDNCIDCGLCEKVCPILHSGKTRMPLKVYAAKNNDERVRLQSSSGGIFTLLAEKVICEGGVVFGAMFDENWDVKHGYTETIEGLDAFRGSKYVQSRMENNYREVEFFLKEGRHVLFSGTPCQISGLKLFLRKEYENLLTVDFICHGVPSPSVWRKYLKETVKRLWNKNSVSTDPISKENVHVESISFRDKSFGWKKYSFALTLSVTSRSGAKNTVSLLNSKYKNPFLKGFLRNLYLRPSCHACVAKTFKSSSDITIADFWGINDHMKKLNDHKGYSLIFLHDKEIYSICDEANLDCRYVDLDKILKTNLSITKSAHPHKNRDMFFEEFVKREQSVECLIAKYGTISFKNKMKLYLASLLKN